jgi:hypothetical protein
MVVRSATHGEPATRSGSEKPDYQFRKNPPSDWAGRAKFTIVRGEVNVRMVQSSHRESHCPGSPQPDLRLPEPPHRPTGPVLCGPRPQGPRVRARGRYRAEAAARTRDPELGTPPRRELGRRPVRPGAGDQRLRGAAGRGGESQWRGYRPPHEPPVPAPGTPLLSDPRAPCPLRSPRRPWRATLRVSGLGGHDSLNAKGNFDQQRLLALPTWTGRHHHRLASRRIGE